MSLRIKKKQIEDKAIDGSKIELGAGDALRAQDPSQNNTSVDLLEIDQDGDVLIKDQEIAFKTDVTSLQSQVTEIDEQLDLLPIEPQVTVTSSLASGTLFSVTGRSFTAQVSVFTNNSAEVFQLMGIYNESQWFLCQTAVGETTNVAFSISSVGVVSFTGTADQAKTIKYILSKTSV